MAGGVGAAPTSADLESAAFADMLTPNVHYNIQYLLIVFIHI